jgi:hypothetical protein
MVVCVALVVNFEIDLTKLVVKSKFDFNEFKKFLLDHLTESAIKQTIFIKVTKIYRNDNGKILRNKLSEYYKEELTNNILMKNFGDDN